MTHGTRTPTNRRVVDHFDAVRREGPETPTPVLSRLEDLLDLGYAIRDVETSGDLILVTLSRDGLCAVVTLEAADARIALEDLLR